jgi:long-chain acyl-CoA synthetase
MMWLVHHFLENSARQYPDKTALIFREQRLTYAEVEVRSNALSHALIERGVKRGDRVMIWYRNSVECCVAIFATLKAGGVFVVINPTTRRDKLFFLLGNCRPKVLLTGEQGLAELGDDLAEKHPALHIILAEKGRSSATTAVYDDLIASYPTHVPESAVIDRDLAALIYTSGSTGFPKGVMSAHYNMVAAATSITQYLQNTPDDVIFIALPLAFDYGLYQLLMAFLMGATLVLETAFTFPVEHLALMRREHVTGFPGVPSIFSILLQLDPKHLRLPDLRYITNTAANLPVSHILQMRQLFPAPIRIYSMYGQTECKRTLYLPPEELERRPTSVGIPIPNEEVFVVDENFKEVPPGTRGELIVRGANVMLGYWENPQETARTFLPGPLPGERILRSHDIFWRDEEGFLYFVARQDDIIKSRGQKVSPREVETALYQIPGITGAAVIGVEDPQWGQVIEAHVALGEGVQLTAKNIIMHCKQLLEDFMVPQRIVFHDALPLTESGKIKYADLRAASES